VNLGQSVNIVARTQTHSQVKMSPLKCGVAKSASEISTQFSGHLSGILAITLKLAS